MIDKFINFPVYGKILTCAGLLAFLFIAVIAAYFILSWIYLVVLSFFSSNTKEYTKPSKFWYKSYTYCIRLICQTVRAKLHVTGEEKIPYGTRFLLISNHRSNFDNICQGTVFNKEHISYISKPENFKIPFAGRYIRRNMFLSIDRGNMRQSAETILKAIKYIKEDYFSIAVYPEGTRSKDGKFHEFKPGCFKIAEKTKCPIVVTSIQGTEQIHKNVPWKRTHVYIDVIDVIQPEQYENLSTVEISDMVHGMIEGKLNKGDRPLE